MTLDIEQIRWNVQHLPEGERRAQIRELLEQRSHARDRKETLSDEQQALLNLLLDAVAIPVRETPEEKEIRLQINRGLDGLNGDLEGFRKLPWREPNLEQNLPK